MSRHKIRLMPLTSLHIGSGEKLSNGCDFLVDDRFVYILDEAKIGAQLDVEHKPEMLRRWADAAYRLDLKQFLNSCHVDLRRVSRVLDNYASSFTFNSQLSSFIRDGQDCCYVPGSSIKGAIRTAIVTWLVNTKREKLLSSSSMRDAEKWEDELLGKIQQSFMRFIRVGDARLLNGEGKTEVINTVQLKIDKKTGRPMVDTIKQYCEVLKPEEINDLEFTLTIDTEGYERAFSSRIPGFEVKEMPTVLQSANNLFRLINAHTLRLINSELQKWQGGGSSVEKDKMVECLNNVKDEAEQCVAEGNHRCVMRMGNGSGWRFMTGAWAERLRDIAIGPYRSKTPKTRRIDEDSCDLLGFVMLELVD